GHRDRRRRGSADDPERPGRAARRLARARPHRARARRGRRARRASRGEQRRAAAVSKELPVPDGLAGERVDAGLARLLGLSRTRAAELAAAGKVVLDGVTVGKSDRLLPGAWLEVDLDEARVEQAPPEPVPGMRIVHEDEEIV